MRTRASPGPGTGEAFFEDLQVAGSGGRLDQRAHSGVHTGVTRDARPLTSRISPAAPACTP